MKNCAPSLTRKKPRCPTRGTDPLAKIAIIRPIFAKRSCHGDNEYFFARPDEEWVEAQGESGRYSNASDYVRDLIRRDQERGRRVVIETPRQRG